MPAADAAADKEFRIQQIIEEAHNIETPVAALVDITCLLHIQSSTNDQKIIAVNNWLQQLKMQLIPYDLACQRFDLLARAAIMEGQDQLSM